jgi:hypothetical protein
MELRFGLKKSAGISREIPASLGETPEGDATPLPVKSDQLRRRRIGSARRISAIRQQLLRMPLLFDTMIDLHFLGNHNYLSRIRRVRRPV